MMMGSADLEPVSAEVFNNPLASAGIDQLYLDFTLTLGQQTVPHPVLPSKIASTPLIGIVLA